MRQSLVGLLALVFAGLLVFAAAPAQAQEQINAFTSAVVVNPDTSLSISEQITYQFPDGEQRHGIVRDLVVEEPQSDGRIWHYGVEVTQVTADGQPVPFEMSGEGALMRVKIGDPNSTVSGTVVYDINYRVTGALRAYSADELDGSEPYAVGDVELYWDLIGSGWTVPILGATGQVTGPADPLAYGCYFGPAGSTADCPVAQDGAALTFGPVDLQPESALTAVIAFPGSAFTSPVTPDISEPSALDDPALGLAIGVPLAIIALAAPIAAVLISRRRLRGAELDGAPVQFAPPGNLRPAELQASATGEVDAAGALATLLDLVARGHISLTADDGGFMQKPSITVTWKSANPDEMSPWEQDLLASILNGETSGTLSGYDAGFAAAVRKLSRQLVAEAKTAGRWSADRNPRWRNALRLLIGLGAVLVFAGFLGAAVGAAVTVIAVMTGFALVIGAVIALLLVPIHQTQTSAQFLAEYRGFRKLLDTDAAEARRELVQRMNMPDYAVFATMLPYAVIYGLDESWTHAFPDLDPEDLRRAGYNVTSTSMLYGMVSASRMSMTSASSTPSRSSGSGFSGGSAGGGGGGGGGGSW